MTLNKHGVVFSYHGVAIGKEMKVRDIAPLGIRIPPEIKEKLKEKAKEEGRSLNSEIVQRLIRSLKVEAPTAVTVRASVSTNRIRKY
ncbi:YlcI/YnfO family protein [Escherichia coli]|uniref:YlcI/YnfO family protein n=1 Tax=Escherichia coli TaxID=562 RepID=UPI00234EC117|nr:YlcI/YnfO family protein [Escherichia coli]WCQ46438.1 Arc family DNA-binding protein [Escherichia coli]